MFQWPHPHLEGAAGPLAGREQRVPGSAHSRGRARPTRTAAPAGGDGGRAGRRDGGREKPPAVGASSMPSRGRGGRTAAPLTQRMRLSQSSGSAGFASMAVTATASPLPSSRPRSSGSGPGSAPPARLGGGGAASSTDHSAPAPALRGREWQRGWPITADEGRARANHGETRWRRGLPSWPHRLREGASRDRATLPGLCHPPPADVWAERHRVTHPERAPGPRAPRCPGTAREAPLRANMAGAASSSPPRCQRCRGQDGPGRSRVKSCECCPELPVLKV